MLNVIYEDNHLLVVIKEHNIPSQQDSSNDKDMLTICKEYIKEKYNKQGEVYLGLVHRLDRPTGGVMVFARTSKSANRLSEQIKSGEFEKEYLAVTLGSPQNKTDVLKDYLVKDTENNIVKIGSQYDKDSKYAELAYNVIDSKDNLNLFKVKLATGRSHQIRVQLSNMNCPIFADVKYGDKIKRNSNLALWAYSLKFTHPTTKERLTFKVYPNLDSKPWNTFESKIKNLF